MLARGSRPITEPRAHRYEESITRRGVAADDLPLVRRELLRLVEDRRGDVELADVVQQRGPVQLAPALGIERQLLADQISVRTNPLAVTARKPIVRAHRADQSHHERGRVFARRELGVGSRACERALQRLAGTGLQRNREARRRVIGEHQRQPQHRRHREQAPRGLVDRPHRHARENDQAEDPRAEGQEIRGSGHEPGGDLHRRDRRQHGDEERNGNDRAADDRPRLPCSFAQVVQLRARGTAGCRDLLLDPCFDRRHSGTSSVRT